MASRGRGGYAGVVVSQGRVLLMDRQTDPSEVERVLAFDAADGELLWDHSYAVQYGDLDYGNGPRAAPTIHDGRVYTLGAVGHVHCLDLADGSVHWAIDFVGDRSAELPTWGLAASPVVWRDLVIVQVGVRPDGCLMALDRHTGDEVWRASTDGAGYATPIVIEVDGRDQLVCWTPQHVLGVDPTDGRVVWSVPYEVAYGVSIATPIFHRGILFVTGYWEGSKAIRLGPGYEDAELIWEDTRQLRGLMSQPLYRNGYVYTIDKNLGLTCFELESGRKLWDDRHQMTPRGRNPQATMVWLGDGADGRAIILNAEGDLILARFTPDGYEEGSRTKIIGDTWAHPAYAGRRVFARSDTELVCYRLTDDAG